LQEQLEQIESEMSILREPSNCVHPDYLARLVCLDERRDEKLHYENTLLKFNLKALVTRTIAERGQLLSQYHQEIRETRDRSIDNCYKELYALQKDRRRYGTEESSITLFSTSRPEQLRAQAAYNMEVSILAGVSKHIGFPAAPEISPLSPSELQRDLEIMEVCQLLQSVETQRTDFHRLIDNQRKTYFELNRLQTALRQEISFLNEHHGRTHSILLTQMVL
jgi:hypothetical protein